MSNISCNHYQRCSVPICLVGEKRLTPKQAVKKQCVQCVGGNRKDVVVCDADNPAYMLCPFHPYRLKGRVSVKIIRQFCLQCMGGSHKLVRECRTETCPVYLYRFGTNPACKRKTQITVKPRLDLCKKRQDRQGIFCQDQRTATGVKDCPS
jgi:hypothetical protein